MWSAPEALRSQLDQVASFPRCYGNEEGSKGPPWLPVFTGIRTPDPSNQTRSLNALGYRATYTVMFKIPSYMNTELDSIDKYLILIRITFAVYFSQFPNQKNGQLSLSNWALVWSRAIAEQDLLEAQSGLDINVELNLSGLTSSD